MITAGFTPWPQVFYVRLLDSPIEADRPPAAPTTPADDTGRPIGDPITRLGTTVTNGEGVVLEGTALTWTEPL